MGFSGVSVIRNLPVNAGDMKPGFDAWVGKIPWRRVWQPTPLFLPGESHGHRSLAGYSPWGHKESDMTWWLKKNKKNISSFSFNFLDLRDIQKCVLHFSNIWRLSTYLLS